MAEFRRGRIIENKEVNDVHFKGFLPQVVKTADALDYFLKEFVEKDIINPTFREDFENGKYKVEVSYFPVYRILWNANVSWNTTSSNDEVIGDYVVTTKTTTRHTQQKSDGMTVSPSGDDWNIYLKVEDYDDSDVRTLGNINGLELRWFYTGNNGGWQSTPISSEELGQKALDKASSQEDKKSSVHIKWRAAIILVPILSIYRIEDNLTIFAMNLYNKAVGLDDVPLRPDLDKKLVGYGKIGKYMKLGMFGAFVLQVALPFMRSAFKWWLPFIWVVTLAAYFIMIYAPESNRRGIRERIVRHPEGGFFRIQTAMFVCCVIYVLAVLAVGIFL